MTKATFAAYDHTASIFANGELATVDWRINLYSVFVVNPSATTKAAAEVGCTQLATAFGYTQDSKVITNTSVAVRNSINTGISADDVQWTSTGGDIGPAVAAMIFDNITSRPLFYTIFALAQTSNADNIFIIKLGNDICQGRLETIITIPSVPDFAIASYAPVIDTRPDPTILFHFDGTTPYSTSGNGYNDDYVNAGYQENRGSLAMSAGQWYFLAAYDGTSQSPAPDGKFNKWCANLGYKGSSGSLQSRLTETYYDTKLPGSTDTFTVDFWIYVAQQHLSDAMTNLSATGIKLMSLQAKARVAFVTAQLNLLEVALHGTTSPFELRVNWFDSAQTWQTASLPVGTSGVTWDAWNHIAISADAGTLHYFVNGIGGSTPGVTFSALREYPAYADELRLGSMTLDGPDPNGFYWTAGDSGNYTSPGRYLAYDSPAGSNRDVRAPAVYMDEFRYIPGLADYTTNFTPPTEQYPNYNNQQNRNVTCIGNDGNVSLSATEWRYHVGLLTQNTGNTISFSGNTISTTGSNFTNLTNQHIIEVATNSGVNDGRYRIASFTANTITVDYNIENKQLHTFVTESSVDAGQTTITKSNTTTDYFSHFSVYNNYRNVGQRGQEVWMLIAGHKDNYWFYDDLDRTGVDLFTPAYGGKYTNGDFGLTILKRNAQVEAAYLAEGYFITYDYDLRNISVGGYPEGYQVASIVETIGGASWARGFGPYPDSWIIANVITGNTANGPITIPSVTLQPLGTLYIVVAQKYPSGNYNVLLEGEPSGMPNLGFPLDHVSGFYDGGFSAFGDTIIQYFSGWIFSGGDTGEIKLYAYEECEYICVVFVDAPDLDQ